MDQHMAELTLCQINALFWGVKLMVHWEKQWIKYKWMCVFEHSEIDVRACVCGHERIKLMENYEFSTDTKLFCVFVAWNFLQHFNIENGINPNIYQIVEEKNSFVCACANAYLFAFLFAFTHIQHENSNFTHSAMIMMMMIIEWLINRKIPMYLDGISHQQKMHVDESRGGGKADIQCEYAANTNERSKQTNRTTWMGARCVFGLNATSTRTNKCRIKLKWWLLAK